MLKEGSYQELQTSNFDFTNLIGSSTETEVLVDNEREMEKSISHSSEKRSTGSSVASYNAEETKTNEIETKPVELAETRSFGNVKFNVYLSYILAGGHYCKALSLLVVCILTQVLASGGDYWITYW